ncbi:MAG: hypothetical protein KDA61_05210, partial [Planctomycetales bacterium]|nr:hypothetical protein [Planctomycetales bacterium]
RVECPDLRFRDVEEGLYYATRACHLTNFAVPEPLRVLAAAHAQAGAWDDAIYWLEAAIEFAPPADREKLKTLWRQYDEKRCKGVDVFL